METSRRYRIAVGGYRIECSEFTPHRSGTECFDFQRGEELVALYPWATGDMSMLPADRVVRFGKIEKIEGIELVPLVRCRALPGGPMTRECFDAWESEFFELLMAAHEEEPLDALLLDIHGASSVEGLDDGEGYVAAHARELLGPDVVIAAAMDPHGNVSDQLFDACDILTSYRTAPHIDPHWTIYRAVRSIVSVLEHPGQILYKAKADVPILLPGEKTSTEVEPGKSLYGALDRYDVGEDVLDCAIWMGYPWADQARCHGAVAAMGYDEAAVNAAAAEAAEAFWSRVDKFEFVGPVDTVESAVAEALASDAKPYFLSDMGDNPGAGGTDDSTVVLAHLLSEYRASGCTKTVVFASLNDAPAVEACYAAGEGAQVQLYAGAATGGVSGEPIFFDAQVAKLFTDSDRSGGRAALLAMDDFKVIVTESRTQFSMASQYLAAGVDINEEDIVVVKMGYLEPDLSAAAKGWCMVMGPGAVDQDLPRLPRKNIVHPLYPFDELPFEPDLSLRCASRQLPRAR